MAKKKYKMLILGGAHKGGLADCYNENFKKLGWETKLFNLRESRTQKSFGNLTTKIVRKIWPNIIYKLNNKRLKRLIENEPVDAIFVFKGMELFPGTVAFLKEHSRCLVNYNPDHPFKYFTKSSGNKNVRKSIKYYDIHFSYSQKIVELLKEKQELAYRIPFGYDERLVKNMNPSSGNGQNISFVGAWDPQRSKILEEIYSKRLRIYGHTAWKRKNRIRPKIIKAYQGIPVHGHDLVNVVENSIACINMLRPQNIVEQSHNMRTFEVPGYGGCMVANRTFEQMQFFDDEREAIYFESIDELKSVLAFLIKNPRVVQDIRKNAILRSKKCGYSYASRVNEVNNILREFLR